MRYYIFIISHEIMRPNMQTTLEGLEIDFDNIYNNSLSPM